MLYCMQRCRAQYFCSISMHLHGTNKARKGASGASGRNKACRYAPTFVCVTLHAQGAARFSFGSDKRTNEHGALKGHTNPCNKKMGA